MSKRKMAAVVRTGAKQLFGQQSNIIGVIYVKANYYSSESKPYNLATYKRGTGGRSSFSGIVATVFGSTGFLGRYVCNRLGKIGSQLIVPYRGDFYDARPLKLVGDLGQVLFTQYNIKDEDSIRKAIKYSNVVINLIGRDWETPAYNFEDVHVKGAARLAKLSKEMGVERFIHVSALNADKEPEPIFLKKGSKFLASKHRGEEAVLNEFPEATIFRPSDVYGQEDRFLRYYIHMWRRQGEMMPLWKKGEETIKQPVYVGDLAAGIVAAVKDKDTSGTIYQAVGPKRYYLSDLVDWFYRVVRRENFRRYDMRFDPLFKLKITLTEKLRVGFPVGNLHWERVEREYVTDCVRHEIPTLEDLGINLTAMEDQVPWELKPWTVGLYHWRDADDPLQPVDPPKIVL